MSVGVAPCAISYNTVISACAKCGEGDQVRDGGVETLRSPFFVAFSLSPCIFFSCFCLFLLLFLLVFVRRKIIMTRESVVRRTVM